MKKVGVLGWCAGLFISSQAVYAENLAYQFVCSGDGGSSYTGFIDERMNVRAMFEQGESGEQYSYCRSDCYPHFGIRRCSYVIPSQEGHWGPWVKRRKGFSCNEVCLEVRAVDGELDHYISSSDIDITRYSAGIDDSFPIEWSERSHLGSNPPTTRAYHANSSGERLGYTFCWEDDDWGRNFWIAKYDESDPMDGGRMTEVILEDGDRQSHVFRVLGYFKETEAW